MHRYKVTVEYIGEGFCGWQRQDDALSIQQVIEEAILAFTKETVTIFAAGRTDAGVNAYGQVVHFDLQTHYKPYRLTGALNHFIKAQGQAGKIGIISTEEVDHDFHARFSAKQRHYVYKILNRRGIAVIDVKHKTWIREPLDCEKMQIAANYLIGQHDFSSFRASICQSKSPVKTMDDIKIIRNGEDIEIYFSALSFLHHMVRNIVGSLIYVGSGKWQPEKILEILKAKNRSACGPTASATGLYFLKVNY